MKAKDEIARLQTKLADGSLPPDEPLFILRAQDAFAATNVMQWIHDVSQTECPREKIIEALELLKLMLQWPVKQIPGMPETRVNSGN